MIIKVSLPGAGRKPDLSQFTGSQTGDFGSDRFHVNDGINKADAWFVFEDVIPDDNICEVPSGNVFFVSAEAAWPSDYYLQAKMEAFISQFDAVGSCHPTTHPRQSFEAPFLPWMVNGNHGRIFEPHPRDISFLSNFQGVAKTRPLSVFCSNQTWTADHRLRVSFVDHLKKELGDDLDWFGNGVNPVEEKWNGLVHYERTLVLENRQTPRIYTEKILDPFLALSEPIYFGDPELRHKLPVKASNLINIRDFKGATLQIRSILNSPISSEDKDLLRRGKREVLTSLHFLARLSRMARASYQELGPTHARLHRLHSKDFFTAPAGLRQRILAQLENHGRKLFKTLNR